MEKIEERVLAFRKSIVIEPHELENVAGGSGLPHSCSHATLKGAAGSGRGAEMYVDWTVDW